MERKKQLQLLLEFSNAGCLKKFFQAADLLSIRNEFYNKIKPQLIEIQEGKYLKHAFQSSGNCVDQDQHCDLDGKRYTTETIAVNRYIRELVIPGQQTTIKKIKKK